MSDDVVIVDKLPGCIPTCPTVDNNKEHLIENVRSALGLETLFATGRLDASTSGACLSAHMSVFYTASLMTHYSTDCVCYCLRPVLGCVVLARTAKAAAHINEQLRSRAVRKVYTALCAGSEPRLGLVQHGYRRVAKSHAAGKPTLLCPYDPQSMGTDVPGQEWQLAELNVLQYTEVFLRSPVSDSGDRLWECTIQLLTGQTHQIRLQMAALGCPILRDTRYAPVRGRLDDGDDGSGDFGPEPKTPIGLHCTSLAFGSESLLGTGGEGSAEFRSRAP